MEEGSALWLALVDSRWTRSVRGSEGCGSFFAMVAKNLELSSSSRFADVRNHVVVPSRNSREVEKPVETRGELRRPDLPPTFVHVRLGS
jgi:hypothetical protein